jgi:hypothetical protein
MASEIADRLKQDVIKAMKAKEKERLGVLRQIQAAIKQQEVDQRRELTDEDVLQVLQAYAKKVRDAADGAEKAGRDDLAANARTELQVVQAYLPAALSDAELTAVVQEAIAEVGATGPRDMGKVMKAVMPRITGRAEGGRVSALVKQKLAG